MLKKYIISALMITLFFSSAPIALAEEENNADPIAEQLLEKIRALREQIQALQEQIQQLREEQKALREETLALKRQLQEGMQGEDVKILQEMLATDPDIYPEGLITGHFGPMTKRAVQRFQERAGIDQVGRVGPQTLRRINEIFEYGVEGRGVGLEEGVPPGLMRAPGIKRLMGEDYPHFIADSESATENGNDNGNDNDEGDDNDDRDKDNNEENDDNDNEEKEEENNND